MYYSACLQIESHFVISCLCFLPPWNHFYYTVLLVNVFFFFKKAFLNFVFSENSLGWYEHPFLRPLVKQLSALRPSIAPDVCTRVSSTLTPCTTENAIVPVLSKQGFSPSQWHMAHGTSHFALAFALAKWRFHSPVYQLRWIFYNKPSRLHAPQEAQVFTHHVRLWTCVTSR